MTESDLARPWRHFRKAVSRALPEKPGLRFHDLRHTCASLLINLNENPKAIQQYMDHSSIQVTYDRYGHLMPDWQDRLSGKLDALYRDSKASRTKGRGPRAMTTTVNGNASSGVSDSSQAPRGRH
jgi:integrase-like protein